MWLGHQANHYHGDCRGDKQDDAKVHVMNIFDYGWPIINFATASVAIGKV